MLWFQLKPGVVLDSLRDVHCAAPGSHGEDLRSWCRRTFHLAHVQPASAPSLGPQSGQVAPGAPCTECLLRIMTASELLPRPNVEVRTPAGGGGELAVLLRKAQWLLEDAAHYLPEGRCTNDEFELLAATLDQLARAVREHSKRAVVINSAD